MRIREVLAAVAATVAGAALLLAQPAAAAVANAMRLADHDGVLALVNWSGPQSVTLLTPTASRRVPCLFPHTYANGALGFCYYPDPDASPEPGVVAYRAALRRYHQDRPRNRYSLYGYVYGRLVVEGPRRTGRDLTRERLVDALESIRAWDAGGTMPPVSFSASDHHA